MMICVAVGTSVASFVYYTRPAKAYHRRVTAQVVSLFQRAPSGSTAARTVEGPHGLTYVYTGRVYGSLKAALKGSLPPHHRGGYQEVAITGVPRVRCSGLVQYINTRLHLDERVNGGHWRNPARDGEPANWSNWCEALDHATIEVRMSHESTDG